MAELDGCWARLDERLLGAVAAAEQRLGPPGGDPFRGLHLSAQDVTSAFGPPAGAPRLGTSPAGTVEPPAGLAWLVDGYGLTAFDLDALLIGLAPEVDLRYGRVYAYLQDDVRRRRPSVDLVLDLLCGSAEEKRRCRARFAPHAPLLHHLLVHLDAPDADAPMLARLVRPDPQVVDALLGVGGVDRRLRGWCRLLPPAPADDPRVDASAVTAVTALVTEARARAVPLRLHLQGAPVGARRLVAAAAATAARVPLLCVDLATAGEEIALLPLACREARLHGALLLLDGTDAVADNPAVWRLLVDAVARDGGVTLLTGTRPWPPTADTLAGVVTVPVPAPGAATRRACWTAALARHGVDLPADELDTLATRFHLDVAQIDDAAAAAGPTAALRGAPAARLADVSAAARDRSGHALAVLARRIRPRAGWADLVLPPDPTAQLREVCDRARHREQVVNGWGFDRGGTPGLGTSVLFTGGSGTGKTTAAQIVAGELGLDLYAIDLSRVVDKYVGETEKNLARIFDAARDTDAVLFFDEADALFGKRSEVRDSHDRYANIEISFLLQRIEQFDGVAILATNLHQHLDEALLRRLAFSVAFPFPDEAHRRRLWEVVWPEVPRASCVDLDLLARRFPLSGGNIRNIALAASFLAAADGKVVRMEHLMHATRREYQKLGKALGAAELALVSG
ncbi:ATP-binding protein [Pseudonocardia charpentierae]|uniref:ATP-binding protein n=1 Tax=Pseudonocardia charpentierae TaxID=3075545 RepID=A0ABU2NHD2_9PSEU|nr:ATP-binding protein [Pseudonocardia sp. DSM 45834]MDT0353125.1 ATP-binding protein [Pseudonocardia sp. DSM 45834]